MALTNPAKVLLLAGAAITIGVGVGCSSRQSDAAQIDAMIRALVPVARAANDGANFNQVDVIMNAMVGLRGEQALILAASPEAAAKATSDLGTLEHSSEYEALLAKHLGATDVERLNALRKKYAYMPLGWHPRNVGADARPTESDRPAVPVSSEFAFPLPSDTFRYHFAWKPSLPSAVVSGGEFHAGSTEFFDRFASKMQMVESSAGRFDLRKEEQRTLFAAFAGSTFGLPVGATIAIDVTDVDSGRKVFGGTLRAVSATSFTLQ